MDGWIVELNNRRVLVTGASSGIGEAIARSCAKGGAQVILVSNDAANMANVLESIRASGGRAVSAYVDLTRSEDIDGLIERLEQQEGQIDVLINNAGIGLGATILDTRLEDLRFLFELNFFAVHRLCQQALRAMSPRKQGAIVNLTSASARFGSPTVGAYSASKGAVHAYTQALRTEAAPNGIQVGECLPISVRTHFFDSVRGAKYQPGGVVQTPEQVAAAVVRALRKPKLPAEILPYRPVRLAFVVDAVLPGLLQDLLAHKRR
jgi:short-subunit dehydrogenase